MPAFRRSTPSGAFRFSIVNGVRCSRSHIARPTVGLPVSERAAALFLVFGLLLLLLSPLTATADDASVQARSSAPAGPGDPHLHFVENRGQWDSTARYRLDAGSLRVWFAGNSLVYDLHDAGRRYAVRQEFLGASATPRGGDDDQSRWAFFLGKNVAGNARGFGEIRYDELYDGIALRYYERDGGLKYDVVVDPGGNPDQLRFAYSGAEPLLEGDGTLRLSTALGEIVEGRPYSYQVIGGKRRQVPTRFVRDERGIGFSVGHYDRRYPLVIDPALIYSSYLGGTRADSARGIAIDGSGNIYVAGITRSEDFPKTSGALDPFGSSDIFVTKFDPTGRTLIYGTYIGGKQNDDPAGIRVSATGVVTIAGTTTSSDFPRTAGAYDTTLGGSSDGFVLSLTPDGRLRYATLIGGSSDDHIEAFTIDVLDSVFITGWTNSSDFPFTPGVFRSVKGQQEDAFVAKLSSIGDRLSFSTFLGGDGADHATAIAAESGGAVYVTGWTTSTNFLTAGNPYARNLRGGRDCFVSRIQFDGGVLDYSTLIGGSGDDQGTSIAVDSTGAPYITGFTHSANFPTTIVSDPGTGSWFTVRFAWPANGGLVYSRFFARNDAGWGATIQVDRNGDAYLAGPTSASAFPVTSDGINSRTRGGLDVALVHLGGDGTILHSSVIGGSGDDVPWYGSTLDRFGNFWIAGVTTSTDLPLRRGSFDSLYDATGEAGRPADAFFMRYGFQRRPAIFGPIRVAMPPVRCDTVGLLSFWIYNVGDTDLLITTSIFRNGGGRLTIDSIISPFVVPDGSPFRVPPGDSIRYVIRYVSSNVGSDSNQLLIFNNDSSAGKNPFAVTITARRSPPLLTTGSAPLIFDPILLCTLAPRQKSVFVNNPGQLDAVEIASITFISGRAGFSLPQPPITSVAKGERGEIPIRFLPPHAGTFRDTLVIHYGPCGDSLAIPLEGRVDSAAIDLGGSDLRITGVPSCVGGFDTTIVVTNTGTVAATLDSAKLTGSSFSLISFPRSIAVGRSDTVRIHVIASDAGTVTGSFQLFGSPCGLRADLSISVERRPPDTLLAIPGLLDFGAVAGCDGGATLTKDLPVTVRNVGSVPIAPGGARVDAPFSLLDPGSIPGSLAPGASFTMTLRFAPTVVGGASGVLLIPYNAGPCVDTLRVVLGGREDAAALRASTTEIDFGQLLECEKSRDTAIVVENQSDVKIWIDSVVPVEGIGHWRPTLPDTIGPRGRDTIRIRFTPEHTGITDGFLIYRVFPCGDSLRIHVRGSKLGAVFSLGDKPVTFPPILACALPARFDSLLLLHGNGSATFRAEIRSVDVVGDGAFTADRSVEGRAFSPGDTVPLPVHFAPAGAGNYDAVVRVILGPCGDTLRLPLHGSVSEPVLGVKGGAFPTIPVGGSDVEEIVLTNTTPVPIVLNDLAQIAPPFTLLGAIPSMPQLLLPGDSVVLQIRFQPSLPGGYAMTPIAEVSSPCAFTVTVPLLGTALPAPADSLAFCVSGAYSALVGDTVTLTIEGDGERTLATPTDVEYRIRYVPQRMEFLDASSIAGVTVQKDPAGFLLIRESGITSVHRKQVQIRFRLLLGRESEVALHLDSVIAGADERGTPGCADSAIVRISDRCVVAGVAYGKYANLLEPARPNPARGIVEITFQQLEDARTVLSFYDLEGRELLRPLDQDLPGGRYTVRVDVSDLSSGIYLYRIRAGSYSAARMMSVEH